MEKQIFTKDVQALLDKHYEQLTDEEKKQFDEGVEQLTDEQREALDKSLQQQISLSEIYAQCWDDEDFKEEFKADPKKVMGKFGVEYDDNVDYVVLENEPKTITYVLPYAGVKEVVEGITEDFNNKVSDVVEGKQIIPENWCIKFIQNTEDISYIVIPMSPENLTPEELEFVNGCGFFSWIKDHFYVQTFIAVQFILAVETGVVATLAAVALIAVAAVGFLVAAAVAVIE